jgi:hypothetical protein
MKGVGGKGVAKTTTGGKGAASRAAGKGTTPISSAGQQPFGRGKAATPKPKKGK